MSVVHLFFKSISYFIAKHFGQDVPHLAPVDLLPRRRRKSIYPLSGSHIIWFSVAEVLSVLQLRIRYRRKRQHPWAVLAVFWTCTFQVNILVSKWTRLRLNDFRVGFSVFLALLVHGAASVHQTRELAIANTTLFSQFGILLAQVVNRVHRAVCKILKSEIRL